MFQRHPVQHSSIMLVTTNTKNRVPLFGNPSNAAEAIDTLYKVQVWHPFYLYGFVLMPDHCHLLVQIPESGSISKVMHRFKRGLSFNIAQGSIWQSRFHVVIPHDPSAALQYIHNNPVKKGLCLSPEEYPWSSACGKWDVTELESR